MPTPSLLAPYSMRSIHILRDGRRIGSETFTGGPSSSPYVFSDTTFASTHDGWSSCILRPQGAFTPLGLTLLDALARRGAHIIALSSEPIEDGQASIFIPLIRTTTNNENVYAEHCDLASPASIRRFCAGFVKNQEDRLDAVIFAHEYAPCGSVFSSTRADVEERRRAASCATFMISTLLLPLLLVAPSERDIRLITLINPFYAASAPTFAPTSSSNLNSQARNRPQAPLLAAEGTRALRTAVLMRHFQRVLDALPNGSQVPRTDVNASTIPVVSDKVQRSNITTVAVSPGISRTDTVAPLLSADASRGSISFRGLILSVSIPSQVTTRTYMSCL